MSRSQWAAWLLMLCAVHGATATMAGPAATASLESDQLVQIQLSTDIDGQFSLSAGASNRRLFGTSTRLQQGAQLRNLQGTSQDKLDKLLSEVKGGSNTDMKPLLELARAASGPDQVVIVDDSLAARNLRRAGTQAEEETIVVPIYAPSAGQFATPVVVVPTGVAQAPAADGQGNQAEVITEPVTGQPVTTPPKPVAAEPAPHSSQGHPGPGNCISRSPTGQLTVLAAGDSITQGSVPSKNFNHPYTIKMEQVLEAGQQTDVRAVDAGLGGGGVFMTGFNVPVTFGPWLDTYMDQGPWSVVVIMIGINDLLRGGKPADDIMNGLKPMIEKVLATNTPVILIPPFAAPGFVQESDSKEAERKKLAQLFRSYATQHAGRTAGVGPQVWMLDLQATPVFDFYPMPASERTKWLDDGLHMTELAYDTIGEMVAQEISKRTCPNPTTNDDS